jgi:hypothetical protein
MKRRRRHLPVARLILLIGPIVAVAALWLRSYWRADVVSIVRDDGSTRAIVLYQGAIHLIATGTNARARPMRWDSYHIPPAADYAALHRAGSVQWETLGFTRIKTTPLIRVTVSGGTGPVTIAVPAGGTMLPYGRGSAGVLVPWLESMSYEALIVPFWSLALLAMVYPALRGHRVVRGMLRARRGQCIACGYDLRASPERCPECGALPPPKGAV